MGARRADRKPDRLDRLIEAVSRGDRALVSIRDDTLREAVRVALRIHRDAPGGPDDALRSRMRRRVLDAVRPHGLTLADLVEGAFALLAKPAPYATRAFVAAAFSLSVLASATVASTDSLPTEPLYDLKLAAEDFRLSLARSAEDRAAVELSIAEHRLAEAERLAAQGYLEEALVASSGYSERIARAAAELAQLEPAAPVTALLAQLDERITAQRTRAQSAAARLLADPVSAPASEIFAVVAAPTLAGGSTHAERVAETAASVAQDLVRVAEARAAKTAHAVRRSAEEARAAAEKAKKGKGGTRSGRRSGN